MVINERMQFQAAEEEDLTENHTDNFEELDDSHFGRNSNRCLSPCFNQHSISRISNDDIQELDEEDDDDEEEEE